MWPAGFEPAARRVSGDRSTGLSYDHAYMLFKPLAYPSTLDRRRTASYVEEHWSPALWHLPEIRGQKPRLIQQRIGLRRWRRGPFSLRRGLESHLLRIT
jgi:hypothetical protein